MTYKNKSEIDEKRLVTLNFLQAIDQAVEEGIVKNVSDFAAKIEEPTTAFSEMKRKRGVTITQLLKSINTFGFNANYFFKLATSPKEPLFKGETHISHSNGSGNQNNVSGNNNRIKNMVSGGNVYHRIDQLIQLLPYQESQEMRHFLNDILNQNKATNDEIADLKKTIQKCEAEIKAKNQELSVKEKKLLEVQETLIAVLLDKK